MGTPRSGDRTKRAHEQRLDWERKRGRICGKARAKRGSIRKSKIGSPNLKRGDGMRHDAGTRIEANGRKGINRERGREFEGSCNKGCHEPGLCKIGKSENSGDSRVLGVFGG